MRGPLILGVRQHRAFHRPTAALLMSSNSEPKPGAMLVIELRNGVRFVWRPDMRCLIPVAQGKQLRDLRPGDHVLFNNEPQTIASIRVYGEQAAAPDRGGK